MANIVLTKKPVVAFDKLAKEILYGFIAFLIAYLFDLAIGFANAETYGWLVPLIDAGEHWIVKSFDEIKPQKEYIPFYNKGLDFFKKVWEWILSKLKK